MRLTFTAYQAEILDDRPEDCIYQCVSENYGGSADLNETIEHVKTCIRSRTINLDEFSLLMKRILIDCLEGSTVCGQLDSCMGHFDGPREQLRYANAVRSVRLLADKFRAAGLPVTFVPDV